jgi:hypothetical protein
MDDVRCTGNEASLLDCPHNTVDNCGPDEGAGVICSYRSFTASTRRPWGGPTSRPDDRLTRRRTTTRTTTARTTSRTARTTAAEVKLVGGSGRHEGNILVGGRPVCDDEHNAQNAKVVCRMLGYPYGQATVKSHFGRVSSTFKMDDVRCTGNEASLLDCRHNTVDDCGPDEGAGVICSNSFFSSFVDGMVPHLQNLAHSRRS